MAKKATTKAEKVERIVISPPNLIVESFIIYGTAPYVQRKFSDKSREQILRDQMVSKAKKRGTTTPRDPEADYTEATHFTVEKGYGIPAGAFRNAMISACRVAGFVMTKARLSVFIETDEMDEEGTALVALNGSPEMHKGHVRLQDGKTSIAVRPMWKEWSATLSVKWDGDQFTRQDVANLIERAGQQVGVGEGRPDSRKSNGVGWGTFTLIKENRWQVKKQGKKS
jgi:hypothetical protein